MLWINKEQGCSFATKPEDLKDWAKEYMSNIY